MENITGKLLTNGVISKKKFECSIGDCVRVDISKGKMDEHLNKHHQRCCSNIGYDPDKKYYPCLNDPPCICPEDVNRVMCFTKQSYCNDHMGRSHPGVVFKKSKGHALSEAHKRAISEKAIAFRAKVKVAFDAVDAAANPPTDPNQPTPTTLTALDRIRDYRDSIGSNPD